MRVAVLGLAAATLAIAATAAPRLSVAVSKAPSALRAGTVWNATVTVRRAGQPLAGAPPVLTLRSGQTSRVVVATSTRRRGEYRARVSLPFAGSWSLQARAAGKSFRLQAVRVLAPAPVTSVVPTADAFPLCGGVDSPLPQYAAALDGANLWVACRDDSEFRRIDTASGETRAVLTAPGPQPYSIAVGGGAVWAATRTPAVSRVDTTTGRGAQLAFDGASPYLWFAAGSLWVAVDDRNMLVRIDPATRRVLAQIPVGDGAAGFVADAQRAWVVNHRDRTLDRIDLATNRVTRLTTLPGDTPERITLAAGSLWITGRGTDLMRVDPETGAVQAVVEIGAGGIDVAAAGGRVWAAAAGTEDDRTGFPVLARLVAVDPATNTVVETLVPTGHVTVDGVVTDGRTIWIADVAAGRLFRLTRG